MNRGMAYGKPSNAKPIFLLSIIVAIESGAIKENKIMYDEKLESIYKGLCNRYEPTIKAALFYKPFFHISREIFYNLIWREGREPFKECHTPSAKYIRENVSYAYLDSDLWNLLQAPEVRNEFREAIISHYLQTDKKNNSL